MSYLVELPRLQLSVARFFEVQLNLPFNGKFLASVWRIVATKKEEIQNYLAVLNVLQHDAENDENLTNDDYDLATEN